MSKTTFNPEKHSLGRMASRISIFDAVTVKIKGIPDNSLPYINIEVIDSAGASQNVVIFCDQDVKVTLSTKVKELTNTTEYVMKNFPNNE